MGARKSIAVKFMFLLLVLAAAASTWTPAQAARFRLRKQTISMGNQGVMVLTRGEISTRVEITKVEAPAGTFGGSARHTGLVFNFMDMERRTVQPDAEVYVYFVLNAKERSRWDAEKGQGLAIWYRGKQATGGWSKCSTALFKTATNGILACRVTKNGMYLLGNIAEDRLPRTERKPDVPQVP